MSDYKVIVYYNKNILDKNDSGYIFTDVRSVHVDEDEYLRILFKNGDLTFIHRDSFYRYDVELR